MAIPYKTPTEPLAEVAPADVAPGQLLTNEDYHREPAISSTDLSLLEESTTHLMNKQLFKRESDAFNFGTLVHTLTLEPHLFDDEFLLAPEGAKRNTTIGKKMWEDHEAELAGRISITAADVEKAKTMAHNATVILSRLLGVEDFKTTGWAERSFFTRDHLTHANVKCRPDFLTRNHTMIDIKTTRDISEFGLMKSIRDYNYARQVAWYKRVLSNCRIDIQRAVLVFVSTEPGHQVKIRYFSDSVLYEEDEKITALLQQFDSVMSGEVVDTIARPIEPLGRN